MKDSFETRGVITLQPDTLTVPYSFTFAAATSATANDGSIPFGSTISSVVVKAYDEDGNDVTAQMVESDSNSTLIVTVELKYPATAGIGVYSLEFILTLNTGAIMTDTFIRVYAKDISA